MQLSLGFSPCPNDTFIFDALIHKKIDTKGIDFKLHLADVKELNELAFNSELDISKLSYHAYAYLTEDYVLLNSGSALGNNCGPLLIANEETALHEIPNKTIAIPGKYTTANFLLKLAFPDANKSKVMLFDEIEDAVVSGACDLGLIIHENRFTYQQKGLKKIIDLGEYWEENHRQPIPLGGIAIKRTLDESLQKTVDGLIHESIKFAFDNPESSMEYVQQHAQEMDPEVMKKHIALYVNEFSLNLGKKGKSAISTMYAVASKKNLVPKAKNPIFL